VHRFAEAMADEMRDRIDLRDWAFNFGVRTGDSSYYAVHDGAQRGAAQRGFAVLLTDDATNNQSRTRPYWAAHGFADGYFGAAPTLSPARAAALSLEAINDWLYGMGRTQQEREKSALRLGAILIVGRRLGFVSAGDCTFYLWRQDQLLPLNGDDTAPFHDGTSSVAPLGTVRDIVVEYTDIEAQQGDRYLIALGPLTRHDIETACRGKKMPDVAQTSLLWLDVEQLPKPAFTDLEADFGNLPLRSPPQEGDTLDGFVIGKTIYRSPHTLLRRARDTIGNRDVLLKFPLPAMLQDQVFQAGFLREAWVGRNIKSLWVANYIELPPGRQSCLYIALSFYRGETLEERLLHKPPIGFAEGMSIALRLCSAVDDLNELQVIHRDIKPENVLLPNEGGLRLLDLGLAYLPGIDDPEQERLGGTTRYMAPELFRGAAPDARSEVFALGVTIYRMFSGGKFPFGQWEKQPLSRVRSDLPVWLGKCLNQALAVDPALRFPNAASFAAALEAGLKEGDSRSFLRSSWRLAFGRPQFWQALTALFATAFLITLFILHRR
jgi:hypothetical protein